jgi:hypothetical protein
MLTGASLWLTGRCGAWAVVLAAAVIAFAFSLFVGSAASASTSDFVLARSRALWLVLAPPSCCAISAARGS